MNRFRLQVTVLAVLGTAKLASVAWAANVVVTQQNRAFGVETVTITPGTTINFVNDDYYGHNVYSDEADFDIGLQEPGELRSVTFDKGGTFEVRCRIHPKMRMSVIVAG
ncbi:MAG: cupredoxin domain-containing protein [Alphaproteobacteria bacterium]|nr:cupredoxin domain-containing protein [Alphaproteobacteria bacterium]